MKPNYGIEDLIYQLVPNLRGIVFHTDGHVAVKTGGRAPKPKKLYASRGGANVLEDLRKSLLKLKLDNTPTN